MSRLETLRAANDAARRALEEEYYEAGLIARWVWGMVQANKAGDTEQASRCYEFIAARAPEWHKAEKKSHEAVTYAQSLL